MKTDPGATLDGWGQRSTLEQIPVSTSGALQEAATPLVEGKEKSHLP